jgi:hypothetical protein
MQKPDIIFNDKTDSVSAEQKDRLEQSLTDAYAEWLSLVPNGHDLTIELNVVADAKPQYAVIKSTGAKTVAQTKEGGDLLMPSAGYKVITGIDDSPAPDIVIDVQQAHFDKLAWTDAQLAESKLVDPTMVFRYALAQGLFMRRASSDPMNPDKTTWDLNIEKTADKYYFTGPHVVDGAGGPAPVPVPFGFLLTGKRATDAQSPLQKYPGEILSDCGLPTALSDTLTLGRNGRGELDMGQGFDTIMRQGRQDEYVVSRNTEAFTWDKKTETFRWEVEVAPWKVVHKLTGNELTVWNAERLQFDDTIVALDVDGNAGLVYGVLKTAYGSEPDAQTLGRWVKVVDALGEAANDGHLGERLLRALWDDGLVQSHYGLDELPAGFIENRSARQDALTQFIESVYQMALDRRVAEKDGITDTKGRQFWLNWMNSRIEKIIETAPGDGKIIEVYRDFLLEIVRCDELAYRSEKDTVGLTGIGLDAGAYQNPDIV